MDEKIRGKNDEDTRNLSHDTGLVNCEKPVSPHVLRDPLCVLLFAFGIIVTTIYAKFASAFAGFLFPSQVFADDTIKYLVLSNTVAQLAIVVVLVAVTLGFLPRYPKPYFILWLSASALWIPMYCFRFLRDRAEILGHARVGSYSDICTFGETFFNSANSSFFLLAGLVLLYPNRALFSRFPPTISTNADGPRGYISRYFEPTFWLYSYFKANPIASVLVTVPVILCASLRSGGSSIAEPVISVYSLVSIFVVGWGLAKGVRPISRVSAAACLFAHAIYMTPQLCASLFDPTSWTGLVAIWGPALLLKPLLFTFIALLALRETTQARDEFEGASREYQSKFRHVFANVPQPVFVVRNDIVVEANHAARRVLNITESDMSSLKFTELFVDQRQCSALMRMRDDPMHDPGTSVLAKLRILNVDSSIVPHINAQINVSRQLSSPGEFIAVAVERNEQDLYAIVCMLVHDYIKPRLHIAVGNLRLLSDSGTSGGIDFSTTKSIITKCHGLCIEAWSASEKIRSEFLNSKSRGGHSLQDRVTAVVGQCVGLAHVQASHLAEKLVAERGAQVPRIVIDEGDCSESLVYAEQRQLLLFMQNILINAVRVLAERTTESSPVIDVRVRRNEMWIHVECRDNGPGFGYEAVRAINERVPCGQNTLGAGYLTGMMHVTGWGGRLHVQNLDEGGASVNLFLRYAGEVQ